MKKLILLVTGILCLSNLSAKDYKGAEYRTKESFLYGRFEVRMKATPNEGVLSTLFTYFDGTQADPWATNKWNEIDIEIQGRYRNNVQFNTITPNQVNHVSSVWTDFDPAADYHVYAIEWTPAYVSWYIDGVMVRKQTQSHIATLNRAQKLMMNTWNPTFTDWVGTFSDLSLPAFTYYDWVKVYTYTPGTGNYGEGNNFTFLWEDNFDAFDADRWEKATHTWNGNNSDLVPENVVFADGNMVLCLTKAGSTGMTDVNPPAVLSVLQQDSTFWVRYAEWVLKIPAETKTNYTIPGLTVRSVEQMPDPAVVKVTTSPADPTKNYNFVVQNMVDLRTPGNKLSISNKVPTKLESTKFPLLVDVGSAVSANGFQADQEFNFLRNFGFTEGRTRFYTTAIGNTDADSVFQSDQSGIVTYKTRVPAGKYKVTLMFAEKVHQARNQRVFDVTVESNQFREDSIDIYDRAGYLKAWNLVFDDVPVSDGVLDIHFSAIRGETILSGLRIDYNGALVSVSGQDQQPGPSVELFQNYPNPFNGETTVQFRISKPEEINLQIYDLTGRLVTEKKFGLIQPGLHRFQWNGTNLTNQPVSSGIYFFGLTGSVQSQFKPLHYLK